jgi:hypothetical protein
MDWIWIEEEEEEVVEKEAEEAEEFLLQFFSDSRALNAMLITQLNHFPNCFSKPWRHSHYHHHHQCLSDAKKLLHEEDFHANRHTLFSLATSMPGVLRASGV